MVLKGGSSCKNSRAAGYVATPLDRTQSTVRVHPALCFYYHALPYPFEIACPKEFELCFNAFRRVKTTGRSRMGAA